MIGPELPTYYSFRELAARWHCSESSVARYLRANGVEVLDFAVGSKRGKKLIPVRTVQQVEIRRTKKFR